jgi:hypothetical protein
MNRFGLTFGIGTYYALGHSPEDDFSTNNYTGGSGWAGPWIDQEANSTTPTSGSIRVENRVLRFYSAIAAGGLYRDFVVTVGNITTRTLTLTYRGNTGNDVNQDLFVVELSSNGGTTYDNIATLYSNSVVYQTVTLELLPINGPGTYRLRLRMIGGLDATEDYFVDSISMNIIGETGWPEIPPTPIITDYVNGAYVSGSLGKYSTDWVAAAIFEKTPSPTTLSLFSTINHTTSSYVRNTNLWASALDWTGVNVWDSSGGNRHATLISPRHVLMAAHWPVAQNSSIRFIDASNNIVTRTVTAVAGAGTDILIGLLNADVPAGIKFYKILPSNWTDKLKWQVGFPLISSDQEKKALLTNLSFIYEKVGAYVVWPGMPATAWGERLISGDSGSPIFSVVSGELVIMGAAHYASSGPFTTGNKTNINAAMTTLGGGYQLTEIDLSPYTTF